MKMFENLFISTPQPKFIEIGDRLIIDTNLYDSSTLAQVPYSQFVDNTVNANHIRISTQKMSCNKIYINESLSTSYVNHHNFLINYNTKEIIPDEYDPSIYYSITPYRFSNELRIFKYRKNGNSIEMLSNVSIGYCLKYITQDNDNLYFSQSTYSGYGRPNDFSTVSNASYLQCKIIKVSKSTLSTLQSSSNIGCNGFHNVLHDDDNYIYMSFREDYRNFFVRIKKSDLTSTLFTNLTYTKSSVLPAIYKDHFINLISEGDYKYDYLLGAENASDNVLKPGIFCVKYDFGELNCGTSDVIASKSSCEIDFGDDLEMQTEFEKYSAHTGIGASMSRVSFITKNGNKTYLSFFVHDQTHYRNSSLTGIFTFEVLDSTNLRFTSRLRLDGKERNPLFLGDDSISEIYVPSDSCLYYLKFNNETEGFYLVNSKPITVTTIGEDSLGRVWATDIDEQLHMFSETVVEKVNLKFETSNLEYVGEDIDNNIVINCVNNSGEKIPFNVELVINGNATFADATKKKTVETLAGSDLKVPITIKGPGQISVYPKVVM